MKKVQIMSILLLIITVVIMGVNKFFGPLADWIVRVDGIIMLIGIFFLSYSTFKLHQQ